MMKIGLIRERKTPPDQRVALSPEQCALVKEKFPVELVIEPALIRSFQDDEYRAAGIKLTDRLEDCDLLLGIKEVPVDALIPGKTYCFFSHTIKKQAYNRNLLQAVVQKGIHLIDYEVITDDQGRRLIAFGRFAGMVGAHNGVMTWGMRTGAFLLPRMKSFKCYADAVAHYKTVQWPAFKAVLTGTGRVSSGAAEVLVDMGIRRVSPRDFLNESFDHPVFTQLCSEDYVARPDGSAFSKRDFYQDPAAFVSAFEPFTRSADLMINGIFWDKRSPAFFTREDMQHPDFRIRVIADVTCDIAPDSSIPATLRASTIADPVFGYDPFTGQETTPFRDGVIDMMTIDNLPSELPRDASEAFGEKFIQFVLPEFFVNESLMLERATVAKNGCLGKHFQYLKGYLEGQQV